MVGRSPLFASSPLFGSSPVAPRRPGFARRFSVGWNENLLGVKLNEKAKGREEKMRGAVVSHATRNAELDQQIARLEVQIRSLEDSMRNPFNQRDATLLSRIAANLSQVEDQWAELVVVRDELADILDGQLIAAGLMEPDGSQSEPMGRCQ
jgi:hypothetical protein